MKLASFVTLHIIDMDPEDAVDQLLDLAIRSSCLGDLSIRDRCNFKVLRIITATYEPRVMSLPSTVAFDFSHRSSSNLSGKEIAAQVDVLAALWSSPVHLM
ncbi:hypothetical protein K1719_034413 [Acacia pycnantha]|nr:hypothetical protein K1719_034413 [Acacia pycnantha]